MKSGYIVQVYFEVLADNKELAWKQIRRMLHSYELVEPLLDAQVTSFEVDVERVETIEE